MNKTPGNIYLIKIKHNLWKKLKHLFETYFEHEEYNKFWIEQNSKVRPRLIKSNHKQYDVS